MESVHIPLSARFVPIGTECESMKAKEIEEWMIDLCCFEESDPLLTQKRAVRKRPHMIKLLTDFDGMFFLIEICLESS